MPVDSHDPSLAGLPQAKDWLALFAAWAPAHEQSSTPDWMAMLSAPLIEAHPRRSRLAGADLEALDDEISWIVRTIDRKLAPIVDLAAAELGMGTLVSTVAAQWVTYAERSHDDLARAALSDAQRAYSHRAERLLPWR
ncbi:hypothetical protein [Nocardia bhagyanarayanae]|uniref:Uncharacterized protein n=1 Tax=Nocardia bhagyanarayanae TaxID=1215925 RepID=A0A543FG06_9NOCA|nr:hypothetical protein [Nocardia bhagyanarayanae]TQM32711.1 hypothetical protein FB390_4407 [Nocardia bhagyanarayanae]